MARVQTINNRLLLTATAADHQGCKTMGQLCLGLVHYCPKHFERGGRGVDISQMLQATKEVQGGVKKLNAT